jgi:ABC-type sugar transport system ATPase subunit
LPHKKFGVVDRAKLNADARIWLRKVGLGINPNTKTRYLSTAQQQLLEIAKALSANARIIIMDEPTSALSPNEIEVLFNIIRELRTQGIAILYVSHKLEEIFSICDRVTVMRDAEKIKTLDIESTNESELIHLMVGRKLESDYMRKDVSVPPDVLEVKNLNTHKLRDISLSIKQGEILGFCGLMGAGKSELARAIFGVDDITSGEVLFEGQHLRITTENCAKKGIGYIPEDRKLSGLFLNLTVKDNMTISTLRQTSKNAIINRKKEREALGKQITALSIKTPSINQKMSNLSGGNQQKCIIARWLFHDKLKLLIVDEPTRGIDVGAKQEIYNILDRLAGQGVAVMIMSSEMPELIKMSDRVVVLKDGAVTAILDKNDINQETMMKYAVM